MKIARLLENESERLDELESYGVLDTPPERELDDLTLIASQICQTPIALVSLVDLDRQWFKSKVGLAANETGRDVAFCSHAILGEGVFVVNDSHLDERFADNPLVQNQPKVRFYAGAPLKTPAGHHIGTLCVIDHVPRHLSPEQTRALEALARQVITHLELRKQNRSLVRASQLLEHSPAAMLCKDYASGKGVYVDWNRAAEDLWGLTRQAIIGKTDYDRYAKDHADLVNKSDQEVLHSGKAEYFTQESLETAKGRLHLETWKIPVTSENGVARYLWSISLDVTRPVELENELKLAKHNAEMVASRLELALEGAALGIWDWNLTNNEVQFDRRWCEMLGLQLESTPMQLKTWEERVHPEDLKNCYKDITDYLEGKTEFYQNVHRMKHTDGHWVYILDRGRFSAWDSNGKPIRFTGTHFDLTSSEVAKISLQEARQRLEQAEVTGKFGSWELDLLNMKGKWSKGHNILFEFNDQLEEPSFDVFLKMVHPEDRHIPLNIVDNILSAGQRYLDIVYRLILKDGSIRYIKGYGKVIEDDQKKPIRIYGTVQDITDLKVMETQLIASREEAIMATKTKSNFLANLSHEIRTPMNGIIGMCNLLLGSNVNSDQFERLQIIQNCSNTLLNLINDILDFSKLEVGKVALEYIPFPLHTAVKEVMDLFKVRANEKAVELSYYFDENVPEWVVGDVTRFSQVLNNLISNALKFTENGSVLICASAKKEGPKWRLQFDVIDTGIGISPEVKPKLFQSFSQVDASTTRKFGGSGLGLAICKGICEQMDGNITVKSEPGKGSTFTFTILVNEMVGAPPSLKPKSDQLLDSKMADQHPLHILVTEDNRTNQLVAVGLLQKLGYRADVAANGVEALQCLERSNYDLVLMDCHMPEMDGFEATKRIHQQFGEKRPRIVALTASTFKEDIDRCLAAGMDDFIGKPVQVADLVRALSATKTPRLPSFDFAKFETHFASVPDVAEHAIESFLTVVPKLLADIESAIQRGEARALEVSAHTLKGAVSHFFAEPARNIAMNLEQMGKAKNVDGAQELFKRLQDEIKRLTEQLRTFQTRTGSS